MSLGPGCRRFDNRERWSGMRTGGGWAGVPLRILKKGRVLLVVTWVKNNNVEARGENGRRM
jgi:hypothetical protein